MRKNNGTMKDGKNNPKALFVYLKHLWKDPVKTLQEAKMRKKEIMNLFIISLAMFIVPTLLPNDFLSVFPEGIYKVLKGILDVLAFVGCIGGIYCAILFCIMKKVTAALKLRECEKCKEIINNIDSVTYEVLNEWVTKKTETTNNGSVHITQDDMALVKISCVCQNCGTPKQFTREFNLAHFLDGKLKFSYELDELIEDFMTGKKI